MAIAEVEVTSHLQKDGRKVEAGRVPLRPISLYVHVPFCAQKCNYCAFYSRPPQGDQVNRFVKALITEMDLVAGHWLPATIFFGGGTPSLLNLRQWEDVLQAMARHGWTGRGVEWTVECNPATVSLDKARLLKSHGVSRISMGVQSLDDALLDRLGRVHTRGMVFKSFDTLRQAGFENLNLDLMFAIPGQTMDQWRQTLREVLAMDSEHLSCYEVIYEEDTVLYEQLKAGEFEVSEDLAAAMHDVLVRKSEQAGFRQYEVANFARRREPESDPFVPALACRHNVNYWMGGEHLALGPGACGFLNGERTRNWANTDLYCQQLEQGRRAMEWRETLPPIRRAGEIAAFGLRMNGGWRLREFSRVTGFDLAAEWHSDIAALQQRGWGVLDADRFRLTPLGLRFADTAAMMFLR